MVWMFFTSGIAAIPAIFLECWTLVLHEENKTRTEEKWANNILMNTPWRCLCNNRWTSTYGAIQFYWPYALFIRLFIYLYFHYTHWERERHTRTDTLSRCARPIYSRVGMSIQNGMLNSAWQKTLEMWHMYETDYALSEFVAWMK